MKLGLGNGATVGENGEESAGEFRWPPLSLHKFWILDMEALHCSRSEQFLFNPMCGRLRSNLLKLCDLSMTTFILGLFPVSGSVQMKYINKLAAFIYSL